MLAYIPYMDPMGYIYICIDIYRVNLAMNPMIANLRPSHPCLPRIGRNWERNAIPSPFKVKYP
jgi:hypothetical protein